jgi:hypothetical protein
MRARHGVGQGVEPNRQVQISAPCLPLKRGKSDPSAPSRQPAAHAAGRTYPPPNHQFQKIPNRASLQAVRYLAPNARGFRQPSTGDHKLFEFLDEIGFGYVIRFRGNIHVTDTAGQTQKAADWVGKSGRARKLRGARITASHAYAVGAVVCVHARDMKEPWCLAASDAEAPTAKLIKYYAKRWTIEPSFRDTKDLRFGMGLSATRISEPMRRDRLLLVNAFAMVLLTMLGAAGEALGMDRLLKSNTAKRRVHSLFRQGCMLYELIPTMPEHRLAPLMAKFAEVVSACRAFSGLFAVV